MTLEETLESWLADRGDDLLRSADLDERSLVVDVGAYRGKWLRDMREKYRCRCIGFEPLDFGEVEGAIIHRKALSTRTGRSAISLEGDASTMSRGEVEIETLDAADFFGEEEIDVLQINIEGHEYVLVPYLLEKNLLNRVRKLQIQFHKDMPGSETMHDLVKDLEEVGFSRKFHYENVWWCGEKKF